MGCFLGQQAPIVHAVRGALEVLSDLTDAPQRSSQSEAHTKSSWQDIPVTASQKGTL